MLQLIPAAKDAAEDIITQNILGAVYSLKELSKLGMDATNVAANTCCKRCCRRYYNSKYRGAREKLNTLFRYIE